jgi:hypothetical protein
MDEIMTEAEVAKAMKVSKAYVIGLRKSGKGPSYTKMGNKVRYTAGAIYGWLAQTASVPSILTAKQKANLAALSAKKAGEAKKA